MNEYACEHDRRVPIVLTTNQTTNLEYRNANQEDKLEIEVLVGFTPGRLGCSNSQEESASIPADVLERLEIFGDLWDGGSDDGLLQLVAVN